MARAFTNLRDVVGKEAAPGVEYEALDQFMPSSNDQEENKFAQEPRKPEPPPALEDYVTPDYTRRDEFEKHVLQEIGYDPFSMNPSDAVREADKSLPQLFEYIFRGKVIWDDRHKLSNKQKDYWNKTVKAYHADMYNRAVDAKETGIQQYNYMMNTFDNNKKEYENALTRYKSELDKYRENYGDIAKKKSEDLAAKNKAIEDKTIAKEKRAEERTIAKEERAAKRKAEAGPTREDLIAISKFENDLLEGEDSVVDEETGQIPANYLRQINRAREAAGVPTLEENTVVTPSKKRKLLGIDILMPDTPEGKEFSYTEGKGETKSKSKKEVVESRMYKGRKLNKYSDGSIGWAEE